jgi:methionine-rich copper-binding protein CopC
LDTEAPVVTGVTYGANFGVTWDGSTRLRAGPGATLRFTFDDAVDAKFSLSYTAVPDETISWTPNAANTEWTLDLASAFPETDFTVTITTDTVDVPGNALASAYDVILHGDQSPPSVTFTVFDSTPAAVSALNFDSKTVTVLYSEEPNSVSLAATDLYFGADWASAVQVASGSVSGPSGGDNTFVFTLNSQSQLANDVGNQQGWYFFLDGQVVKDQVDVGSPNPNNSPLMSAAGYDTDFTDPTLSTFAIAPTSVNSNSRVKNGFPVVLTFSESVSGVTPALFEVGTYSGGWGTTFTPADIESIVLGAGLENDGSYSTWTFIVTLTSTAAAANDGSDIAANLACGGTVVDAFGNPFQCSARVSDNHPTFDNSAPSFAQWSFWHPYTGVFDVYSTQGALASEPATPNSAFPWYANQDTPVRVLSLIVTVDGSDAFSFDGISVECANPDVQVTFGTTRFWAAAGRINIAIPENFSGLLQVSLSSMTDSAGNSASWQTDDDIILTINTNTPSLSMLDDVWNENDGDLISATLASDNTFDNAELNNRLVLNGVGAVDADFTGSGFTVASTFPIADGTYDASIGLVYSSATSCPLNFVSLPELRDPSRSFTVAGETSVLFLPPTSCGNVESFAAFYRVLGEGVDVSASVCASNEIDTPRISVQRLGSGCAPECVVSQLGCSVTWTAESGEEYFVVVHSDMPVAPPAHFQLVVSTASLTPLDEILDSKYNRFTYFESQLVVDKTKPTATLVNTRVLDQQNPATAGTPDSLFDEGCDWGVVGGTVSLKLNADDATFGTTLLGDTDVVISLKPSSAASYSDAALSRTAGSNEWVLTDYAFVEADTSVDIKFTVTDSHQNVFQSSVCTLSIDRTPPTLGAFVFNPAPVGPDSYLVSPSGLTVSVDASASDVVAFAVADVHVNFIDSAGTSSCVIQHISDSSVFGDFYCATPLCTLEFKLGSSCTQLANFQGDVEIIIGTQDRYGNTDAISNTFKYDTVAPSDIVFDPVSGSNIARGEDVTFTFLQDEDIDPSTASARFELAPRGFIGYPTSDITNPTVANAGTNVGTVTFDDSVLYDGDYTLYVTATDLATNEGDEQTATYTYDSTPPMVYVWAQPNFGSYQRPCTGLRGQYTAASTTSEVFIDSDLYLTIPAGSSLTASASLYFPFPGSQFFQLSMANGKFRLTVGSDTTGLIDSTGQTKTESLPLNGAVSPASFRTLTFTASADEENDATIEIAWLRGMVWEVVPKYALHSHVCNVNLNGEVHFEFSEPTYNGASITPFALGLDDSAAFYVSNDVFEAGAQVGSPRTTLPFNVEASPVTQFTVSSSNIAKDSVNNIMNPLPLATISVDLNPPSCTPNVVSGTTMQITTASNDYSVVFSCTEDLADWKVTSTLFSGVSLAVPIIATTEVLSSGAPLSSVGQPDSADAITVTLDITSYLEGSSTGPLALSVQISDAAVRDLAGNIVSSAPSTSFSIDAFDPEFVSTTLGSVYGSSGSFDVVYSETIQTTSTPITVNEASCSVDDATAAGDTLTVTWSCEPGTYSLTFSITSASVTDISGRGVHYPVGFPGFETSSDSESPTVTWDTAGTTFGSRITVYLHFSETIANIADVTPFSVSDASCSVDYSELSPNDGTTFSLDISCASESQGSFTASVNAELADFFGNTMSGNLDSGTFYYDSVAPAIDSITASSGHRNPTTVFGADTTTITITFSEDVSGVSVSSFSCGSLSLSGLSGSGDTYTLTVATSAIPANTDSSSFVTCKAVSGNSIVDVLGNALSNDGSQVFGALTTKVSPPTIAETLAPQFSYFNSSITVLVTFDRDMHVPSVVAATSLIVPLSPLSNQPTNDLPVTVTFSTPTVVSVDSKNFLFTITTTPDLAKFANNLLGPITISTTFAGGVVDDLSNGLKSAAQATYNSLSARGLDLRAAFYRENANLPPFKAFGRTKTYPIALDEEVMIPSQSEVYIYVSAGDPSCLQSFTVGPIGVYSDSFTASPVWAECGGVSFSIFLSPQVADRGGNGADYDVANGYFTYDLDGLGPAVTDVFAGVDTYGTREYMGENASVDLPKLTGTFSVTVRFDELLEPSTFSIDDFDWTYSADASCAVSSVGAYGVGNTKQFAVLSCSVTADTEGAFVLTVVPGFVDKIDPPNPFKSEAIEESTRVIGTAYSWYVDGVAPDVASSSPSGPGARVSNQAGYDTVTVVWDEELDSSSCDASHVELYLDASGPYTPSDLFCDGQTWTITVSSVSGLTSSDGGLLSIRFTSDVKDVIGNSVDPSTSVSLTWDNLGPSITSFEVSPLVEGVLLPASFKIAVSFSTPVLVPTNTLSYGSFDFFCESACPTVPAITNVACLSTIDELYCQDFEFSFTTPDVPNEENDVPAMTISFPKRNSDWNDGVDNTFDGEAQTKDVTIDSTPPRVTFADPNSGDTIPLAPSFLYIFSEPVVQPADASLALFHDESQVDIAVSVYGRSNVWAYSVFLPDGFNSDDRLTAILGPVRDIAGNVITDYETTNVLVDWRVPYLVSTSPAVGSGFRPNGNHTIAFTFSENIYQVFPYNFRLIENGFIRNDLIVAMDFTPPSTTIVLTVDLTGRPETADLRVNIIGGTIKDQNGNGVPQVSALFSIDDTPPAFVSATPAGPNVGAIFYANLTFSEKVFFGSTPVIVSVCSNSFPVNVLEEVNSIYQAFLIDTTALVSCADGSTLTVAVPAVPDVTGVMYTSPTTLTYTLLRSAPELVSITILNETYTNTLGADEVVVFTFNKAIRPVGVSPRVVISASDIAATGAQLVSATLADGDTAVQVRVRLFSSAATFSIQLDSADYTDAAGNSISASATFTGSVDVDAPMISTTSPAVNAFVQSAFTLTVEWNERPESTSANGVGGDCGIEGTTCTYAVSSSSVALDAEDIYGNYAAFALNFRTDNVIPTVQWTPSTDVVFGAVADFNLLFSEVVSVFTAVQTDGDGFLGQSLNANGFVARVNLTVGAGFSGTAHIVLTFSDLAGNTNVTTMSISYETVAPSVSASASGVVDGFVGPHFSLLVTITDAPDAAASVDLQLARSGLLLSSANLFSTAVLDANRIIYFLDSVEDGLSVDIDFSSSNFVDGRGNVATAPEALSFTSDMAGPVITIEQPAASSRVGPVSRRISFTVSDAGVGVDLNTVSISNVACDLPWNFTTPLTVATANGVTTASFDATWTSLSGPATITVSSIKDRLGNVAESASQDFIVDPTALTVSFSPTVGAVGLSADSGANRYTLPASITVTFSEAPAVFDGSFITAAGLILSEVTPVSATVFSFEITDADDGVRTVSVAGVIADETSNGLFGNTAFSFMVDRTRPTVSLVSPVQATIVSRSIAVDVDFSEPVSFANGDITIVGGTILSVTPVSQIVGNHYWISIAVADGVSQVALTFTQNIIDTYGNGIESDQTFTWSVDQASPVASLSTPAPASFVQDVTSVVINLSDSSAIQEPVADDSITLYNGATLVGTSASVDVSVSGTETTLTFSFGAGFQAPEGALIIRLAPQRDVAGNVIAAQSWPVVVDRTAPAYTIATTKASGASMGSSSTTLGRNAYVVVSFSEPIAFDSATVLAIVASANQVSATFALDNAVGSAGLWTQVTYRVEQLSDASASVSFGVNVSSLTDRAGNSFAANPTADVTIDTTAPMFTLTPQYSSPSNVIAGSSYVLPVAFSENVVFTASPVLTTSQVSFGTPARIGSTNSFNFPLTGLSDGALTITVSVGDSICDAYENCISESSQEWTVDLTAPTVSSTSPAADAYVATGSVAVDITFNEDVSAASLSFRSMVGITPSTVFAAAPSIEGSSVSFAATTLADAVYTATVSFTDLFGNSASYSWVFTVDTVAPTCVVDSVTPSYSGVVNAAPAFAVTCSEVLQSIPTVSGAGTVTSTGGNSYTFSFSGLSDGDSLTAAIIAVDLAGNTATSSTSYTVDNVAPTDNNTPDSETYSVPTGSRVFPIKFSEAVVLSGTPFVVSQGAIVRYTAVDASNYELVLSGLMPGDLVVTIGGASTITDRVLNAMQQITKNYVIDNTAPSVNNVSVSAWFAPDFLTSTSQTVTVNFTEPTVITDSQVFFTLPPSTTPITGSFVSASPCTACQFTFAGLPQGRVVLQVSGFADRYGNVQLTPYQQVLRVDTVAPSVSSVTVAPVYSTNILGAVVTFTVTFSESMASFAASTDMTFTGTTPSSVITTGSGSVWTVVASGLSANFALGFNSNAKDFANNGLGAFSAVNYVVDIVKPTLTAAQFNGVGLNSSSFTLAGTTLLFDLTFSEPVNTLSLSDLAITTGAGSVTAISRISNDPTHWAVTISGVAEGSYVVSVSPAASQIKDRVDNTLDTVSLTWTVDKTAPSLLISETPASGSTVSARPFSLVLVFNERIVPLVASDISYSQTALGVNPAVNSVATAVSNVWNGANHTFTITAPATLRDGVVTVSVINIRDTQSNARQALTFSYILDFTGPVAFVSVVSPASGTLAASGRVQVTFNEDVPAFQGSSVIVSAGQVDSVYTTIAGRQFQFDVSGLSGMAPLTVQFIGVTDMFGNAIGATTYDLAVDAVAPTIASVAPAPGQTYSGVAFQVSFTPSESVSWGASSAVATVDGAPFGSPLATVSMNSYVLRWTNVPTGVLTVTLNEDSSVKDVADNLLAVVSFNFTIDNVAPTTNDASVTPAPGSFLRPGDNVTIVFSEALDASTVLTSSVQFAGLSGLPVSAVAVVGSGNTWSWTVPAVSDGAFTMLVAGVRDLVGNLLTPYYAPYLVDLTPAVATVSVATGNVVGVSANVTISFSEPVITVYPQNVTCNNGVVSAVSATGDARVWIIRVVSINQTTSGWMNLTVVSSDVSRRQPRTVGPFAFVVDTTGPVVTAFFPNATVGPVNSQVRVLFSLDEQVGPVSAGAITASVAGTAAAVGPVVPLGGNNYAVDVTAPNGAVVVTFTSSIRDILGNAHRGSSFSFGVDGIRPLASAIQDGTSFTDPEFQINVVFSERVQNVDSNDFVVSAGSGVVSVINVTASDAVLRITKALRGELKISTSQNSDIVDLVGNPVVPVTFTFMIAPAAADPASVKITPIIECIQDLGESQYEVFFGYNSLEQLPITVPVLSTFNTFSGTLVGNPEPTFEPGRAVLAFSAKWNGAAGASWRVGNFRVDVPAYSSAVACPATVSLTLDSADDLSAEQLAALRRALAELGQVAVEGVSFGSKKRAIKATYQALVNSTSAAATITNAPPSSVQTAYSNAGVPPSVSTNVAADSTGLGLVTGGSVIPPVAAPQDVSGNVAVTGGGIAGIVIGVLIVGLIIGGIIVFVVLRIVRKKNDKEGKADDKAFDSKKAQKDPKPEPKTAVPAPVPAPVSEKKDKKKAAPAPVEESSYSRGRSDSRSGSGSRSPSRTPPRSRSPSGSRSPSQSGSRSRSPSGSRSPSASRSRSASRSGSHSPSRSRSASGSRSPSRSASSSSRSRSPSPSRSEEHSGEVNFDNDQ